MSHILVLSDDKVYQFGVKYYHTKHYTCETPMKNRDYRKEYDRYQSLPKQKKNRAKRNLWNRRLKDKVPSGMEIDHKIPLMNGGSNLKKNIRLRSIKNNRADKKALVKKALWEGFYDELRKVIS